MPPVAAATFVYARAPVDAAAMAAELTALTKSRALRVYLARMPSTAVLSAPSVFPGDDGLLMSPASPLRDTLRFAAIVAGKPCPVFLHGESGTGKELLARFLHRRGPRSGGPFVAVNCGAISPHLIESELFGHRKGAFTGAHADYPGKFRLAEGGVLFLDEVGDMPPEAQTKLLRVLQENTVCPVGGQREYAVNFRLICATHRDLRKAVAAGSFREDLFYRINAFQHIGILSLEFHVDKLSRPLL